MRVGPVVPAAAGAVCERAMRAAPQVETAMADQPRVGRRSCAKRVAPSSEDDGHGADHERGVRDGGEGEAVELDEELERDTEEAGEGQKDAPLVRGVKAGAVA